MSVWISDQKLLIFASLISPSKMILFEKKYQTFDTVFHDQMKHLEVRQKYSAARRIFQLSSRCFIWWWNTASHVWYITSLDETELFSVECSCVTLLCGWLRKSLAFSSANHKCAKFHYFLAFMFSRTFQFTFFALISYWLLGLFASAVIGLI